MFTRESNRESGPIPPGFSSAFGELMQLRGTAVAEQEIQIEGTDPFFPTPYYIGESVAAALAMVGVAANDLWELRTGRRQRLKLHVNHAAATLRTVDYTEQLGQDGQWHTFPRTPTMAHMLQVTQPWQTQDGRWFLPHLNLPELSRRVLGVLQCEHNVEGVSSAVGRWRAEALEQAIADARACGGLIRSEEEWLAHPQGQYLAARPVVEIRKVRDSAPVPPPKGDRPLSGVRVLDLTRILAGPVAGRTLAEHGADVLMVTAPHLPQTPEHIRDTSHGKRSCFLDLDQPDQAETLHNLARTSDVFIDGYRPGALARKGFSMEQLFDERPGLVHLSVSCFGSGGPFRDRAGWEQVAQAVTGICHGYGQALGDERPKLVFAPMCDYLTGYLGALGVMLALARRAREGGSYQVHVSLCQSAMFVQRRGRLANFQEAPGRLDEASLNTLFVESDTASNGRLRTLGPVLGMSETMPTWARPTPDFGADPALWLA